MNIGAWRQPVNHYRAVRSLENWEPLQSGWIHSGREDPGARDVGFCRPGPRLLLNSGAGSTPNAGDNYVLTP
jgi:hypothetical protein